MMNRELTKLTTAEYATLFALLRRYQADLEQRVHEFNPQAIEQVLSWIESDKD